MTTFRETFINFREEKAFEYKLIDWNECEMYRGTGMTMVIKPLCLAFNPNLKPLPYLGYKMKR